MSDNDNGAGSNMTTLLTLHFQTYCQLGWRPARNYLFSRHIGLVPIAAVELQQLAQDIPIVFRKRGDHWQAVAILGPAPEVNLFVQPDGLWSAGCVPAVLRSYPFQLSADCGALQLWPDYVPEKVGAAGVEPFFLQGQLTPVLTAALVFLQDWQQAIDRFTLLISWLEKRNVMRPWQVPDVVETAFSNIHCGLFAVDRHALQTLDEADWFEMHQIMPVSYVLPVLHAHLSSLDHAFRFKQLARELRNAGIQRNQPFN